MKQSRKQKIYGGYRDDQMLQKAIDLCHFYIKNQNHSITKMFESGTIAIDYHKYLNRIGNRIKMGSIVTFYINPLPIVINGIESEINKKGGGQILSRFRPHDTVIPVVANPINDDDNINIPVSNFDSISSSDSSPSTLTPTINASSSSSSPNKEYMDIDSVLMLKDFMNNQYHAIEFQAEYIGFRDGDGQLTIYFNSKPFSKYNKEYKKELGKIMHEMGIENKKYITIFNNIILGLLEINDGAFSYSEINIDERIYNYFQCFFGFNYDQCNNKKRKTKKSKKTR
jgi:hypothetical protein